MAPLALDITDAAQTAAAARQASDVDILVNNAGVMRFGTVLSATPEDLAADMDVNYFGTLAVTRAFVPVLEKQGGGLIANVLSVVGLAPLWPAAGYSASKAALFSATQAARVVLKEKNIAVTAIFPGPIDTDLAADLKLDKAAPADAAEDIVRGILAGEEDIYPDPTSKKLSGLWGANPKELERFFAALPG